MFRPCIDLHEGKVKQIVGGTLGEGGIFGESGPKTNFVSDRSAAWFAELYRRDGLAGGHVIMLGPGNEAPAREALAAYPGGLQVGGGINRDNAAAWLDAGASHVIVTSWVFREGRLDEARLAELVKTIGSGRLVLDLSCRKRGADYLVVTDRWQKFTELVVGAETLRKLAKAAPNSWSMLSMWRACAGGSTMSWWRASAAGRLFPSPTRAARTASPTWRKRPAPEGAG